MADVRCPMCAKPNPADAEKCQYCGARLTPLIKSSGSNTPDPSQSEDADWLGSLRGGQNTNPGQAGKTPIREVFVPGPLSKESSNGEGTQDSSNAPDEDFADWLARISQDTPSDEAAAESPDAKQAPSGSGEPDDWLNSLREIPQASDQDKQETPAGSLSGSGGPAEVDWLGRLETPGLELPSDIGGNIPAPEKSPATDEDLPAWLKELSGTSKPAQAEQPSSTSSAGLPDWFENLVQSQATSEVPPQEKATAEPEGTSILSDEEAPLPGAAQAEEAPLQTEKAAGQSGEAPWEGLEPDWSTSKKPANPPQEPTLSEPPAEIQAAPTWETQLPDWLSNPAASTEAPAEEKPEATSWESELPDWLSGVASVESGANAIQPANENVQTTPPSSVPSQAGEPPVLEGELPDWLSNIHPQTPVESSETPQTPPLITDESPITGEQAEVRPFITEEMPDWLVHLGPPEVISTVSQVPESAPSRKPAPRSGKKADEDTTNIAPADLPSWVQAMRPIETATPSVKTSPETDERVENSGPLAGVRGILPGEATVPEIHKPPVYSVKLQVTEKQRNNATLLQTLLTVETEPQKTTRAQPYLSQRLLRVGIALLLILAALIPIFTGGPLTPLPSFLQTQTDQFQAAINAVPADGTVLVAVEYEPGLSGELETISANVIAQLMRKSSNLVFITTNPAGSILSDNLLNRAITLQPKYSVDGKVANLRFLAGGPTALYDFSLAVQSLDPLKAGLMGDWSKPPLNRIKSLSDFSRVIVLTDNADTARAWVEQVKPSLGKTPLLMVASAQSEPMISPYLDSGQISGMITGLTGGSLFEQAANQIVMARSFWDSYQAGLIIMVALILVGGLISIFSLLRSNRRPRGEG